MKRPVIGEAEIQKTVRAFAEARGWVSRKVVYQNRVGAPDVWFMKAPARLIIVEFKRTGAKPSPHQELEIGRLRAMGFDVHVIDDIERGKDLFRERWEDFL